MIDAFIENPILLLFFTIAVGYGVGKIKFGRFQLGVAAVLFTGLLVGSFNPALQISETIIYFGLAVFIYAIGLSSGPGFFNSIKSNGLRDISLIILMLSISGALTIGLCMLLGFEPQTIAGLFAGATTNTAALAGLLDVISQLKGSGIDRAAISEQAVAAYSFAYPMGIIGTLVALISIKKLLKIDFAREEMELKDQYPIKVNIVNQTILITNKDVINIPIRDLRHKYNLKIIFGRIVADDHTELSNWGSTFQVGNQTVIVGEKEEVDRITEIFGERAEKHIAFDQSDYITKRIFVSNPSVVGERISALNIDEKFAAVITRVQRGDMDLLANSSTILELGDIVRFVTRRRDLKRLKKLMGDSYESLGNVNLLTFAGGLALGLFVGMISFNLPGGISFKLGYAGGPILVGLILGSLRKTGNLVWTVSHSANQTFRQFGLAILLAGIGINSGHTFVSQFFDPTSTAILISALGISFFSASLALIIGYKLFKIPFSILMGMMAHQPAILDFALERTKNKLPIVGFTLMLPLALVIKIILVQLMFVMLN